MAGANGTRPAWYNRQSSGTSTSKAAPGSRQTRTRIRGVRRQPQVPPKAALAEVDERLLP